MAYKQEIVIDLVDCAMAYPLPQSDGFHSGGVAPFLRVGIRHFFSADNLILGLFGHVSEGCAISCDSNHQVAVALGMGLSLS